MTRVRVGFIFRGGRRLGVGCTSMQARLPTSREEATTGAVLPATVAAGALIAQQVVGKATRDALFLSHFPVVRLPLATTAGAILSVLVVLGSAALFARRSPARVVRVAFVLNALALAGEWALSLSSEVAAALVVYGHTAALGATLVSAFWSVVNEAFDPHAARRVIGRIGGGAALGGLIGGAVAWSLARHVPVASMLLVMSALNLVCAWGAGAIPPAVRDSHDAASRPRPSGLTALYDTPYLKALAVLVLLAATAQSLLDYAMSVEATQAYGRGAELLAFFAIFQTVVGLVSFLLQTAATEIAFERLGLGGTLALMPGSVVALGALSAAWPSLVTVAVQRVADSVLRASLFRSAYEVLFTPVPNALKRPTKALIDVGFDRIGMVVGSGVTLAVVALFPVDGTRAVTLAAVGASAAMIVVVVRVHRGYVATLADRLRTGVVHVEDVTSLDATTRETVSRTLQTLDRRTLLAELAAMRERERAGGSAASPEAGPAAFDAGAGAFADIPDAVRGADDDPVVAITAELRSRDAATARRALAASAERLPLLAAHVIELLGREELARAATIALQPHAEAIAGQLVDALLDAGRPPAARRRVARLLGRTSSQRAADGLVLALTTSAPDVRLAAARALLEQHHRTPALRLDRDAILAEATRAAQEAHTELTFDLLVLAHPREPIELARDALRTTDRYLRGVALEYLDMVLAPELRAKLAPLLEQAQAHEPEVPPPPRSVRPKEQVVSELLQSKDTIELSLAELRKPDADGG